MALIDFHFICLFNFNLFFKPSILLFE
eukprot:UN06862